tara:strand:- start:2325 stop:2987 length:663 start_codon:yes stop_codon:yes gene_type:complete
MEVRKRRIGLIAIFAAFIALAASAAEFTQPVTPTEHVSAVINEALTVLRDDSLDRESKWAKISEALHRHFDFRAMSQSMLAKHWHSASDSDQHRFVEYFSQYLEVVYRDRIEVYTGQKIEYVDEQINGERALVVIAIVGNSRRIPVAFRLRDNQGQWLAYDVVIDGISLIQNYKETFNAIEKAEGMEGLMDHMASKIAKYRERLGQRDDIAETITSPDTD